MELNIQDKKIELIQWLSTLEDINVIDKLIQLREKAQSDWWDEISEAEKASIIRGLKDAEEGKLLSHSDARKKYEQWL